MKIRYLITVESKDHPRAAISKNSWFVAEESKAVRAVARCIKYKETVKAWYERIELSEDAIVA